MEAKFTRGEWKISPTEDDKEYLRIRGSRIGGKFKISNVFDLKKHHDNSAWCKLEREESMANAHLIKTSPKLYWKLKELADIMDFLDDQTHSSIECDAVKYDIEKLLAEARGEVYE